MLAIALLQWWYTKGWVEAGKRGFGLMQSVMGSFSVPILVRTLFAPWKQIVALKDPNETIGMKLRKVLDNLVSRVVGFMVRSFTLLAAALMMAGSLAVTVAMVAAWPLIPVATILLVAKGLGVV